MFAAAAVAGAVGGLQHTSKQAEDAQSQRMEKLQQNLAETLTAGADPFRLPDNCTPIQGR